MVSHDEVKSVIRTRGPVIPADIAEALKLELLFASAMLSELASKGEVKVSAVKVGGSPLYYLPGQEGTLQKFESRLNEKDRRAYDLLKNEKVLRDVRLEPLQRVSLRQIRDFARPLRVKTKEGEEIFWKWYLLPSEEAEKIIRKMIGQPKPRPKPEQKPAPQVKKEEPKPSTPEKKEEEQQELKEGFQPGDDGFSKQIYSYFRQNSIEVVSQEVKRKGSDIDFVLKVPSAAGKLTFFSKAKSKKKINDGDLSSAYVTGNTKKLPVLFLATGEMTKKAKTMLETEFKGMAFKRL